jgi:DNA-binding response OmpR family regulator
VIFIQQVLIISSQSTQTYEIAECLKQNEIAVSVFPFNLLENKQNAFMNYHFIMINFDSYAKSNEDILKHIKRHSKCPVFTMIPHHNLEEITSYLDIGADGFFTGDDECVLISSKIKAVIRYLDNQSNTTPKIYQIDDLTIDLNNRLVSNHEFKYRLTIVEYMIVKTLLENVNQTVSKDLLIQDVWDKNQSATDNALGIHISRLRKKTVTKGNKQIIETIWGVGYRLNSKEE